MCNTCEKFSKGLLKRNRGTPFQVNLPVNLRSEIIVQYQTVKKEYFNTLHQNMNQLRAGILSQDEFNKAQREAINTAFSGSYGLGKLFGNGKSSQLDETERRFIGYQTFKEMSFMENFANDIVSGGGKMPYTKRMKMYVDGLDSMFGFGRLVYLPDDIQIYWKLGATDKHCLDCLMFVARNPYTKKSLPGFPKSGNSTCLSNCKCSLEYFYGSNRNSTKYDNYITNLPPRRTKEIPTEQQFEDLMGVTDEYYYNKFMYEVSKKPEFKVAAADSLRRFGTYVKTNNLNFPFNFDVANAIKDVKTFKGLSGFKLVDQVSDISEGDFVAVFFGKELQYAKVQKVAGFDILVKTVDQLTARVSLSKNVVFRET